MKLKYWYLDIKDEVVEPIKITERDKEMEKLFKKNLREIVGLPKRLICLKGDKIISPYKEKQK